MIQITGLTKTYRRGSPPALLDLTFDTRPGTVTALLGDRGAGKTTALRLMVELERGRGAALFHGRTYRRLRRPEQVVGVALGDFRAGAGNPGRRAGDHLRMLAAAIGAPARHADDLMEQTRLAGVSGHRLASFSPEMHRRLTLAAALLAEPAALLLDNPTQGISPRGAQWLHGFLRSFAAAGGTVLLTTRSPEEAASVADRMVTLVRGRPVADEGAAEFCRTRLRPEVVVRGPQLARLADLLTLQGARVRPEGREAIVVGGAGRAEIGELAHRHGVLLHELADRAAGGPLPPPVLPAGSGRAGRTVRLRNSPDHAAEAVPVPVPVPVPAVRPAAGAVPEATAAPEPAGGPEAGRPAPYAAPSYAVPPLRAAPPLPRSGPDRSRGERP